MNVSLSEGRDDRELVEAAQQGAVESFGALYERYHGPMVALAYSQLARRDLAEDIAQDVFVIACREIGSLKDPKKFAFWLGGICRNLTRQAIRRKVDPPEPGESLPPEDKEPRHGDLDGVKDAVWRLPDGERDLIVMRYYDGFSQAQISKVLNISPSAVNGRLVRAKRKIAKHLERNGFAGERP